MIYIRTFRAVDDPDACQKFIEGHRRLLEIFGVKKVTSDRPQEWVDDPDAIMILVEEKESKKVYGGARLQLARSGRALPIQTALINYDSRINDLVQEAESKGGTSELCGLWNSREVAGMGIGSHILSRVGATISSQLPITSIFVLCAPITVRMGRRVGAVVETTLGDNGIFYYPKDDLVATAMILRDAETVEYADPNEREIIFDLRKKPHQMQVEVGPKGTFEVEYNLTIPNL